MGMFLKQSTQVIFVQIEFCSNKNVIVREDGCGPEYYVIEEPIGMGKNYWGSGHLACIRDFYDKMDSGERFQNDFANFVQCQEDPMKAYKLLKEYIAYIHVKDANKIDGSVVPAGYGDGNVAVILKDLLASGFDGFANLDDLHNMELIGLIERLNNDMIMLLYKPFFIQ